MTPFLASHIHRQPKPAGVLLGLLLSALLLPQAAPGQVQLQPRPRQQPVRWRADGSDPRDLTNQMPSHFQLFGEADLAWIGNRARGSMFHNFTNNSGPLDYYFVGGSTIVFEANAPFGGSQPFFMGPLWAGTPRSEWNEHRQAVPSLDNVSGGGWNSHWNLNASFLSFPNMWRADDGQLGLVHSTASSTDDGSCTDFTAEFLATGLPLMASSDCPPTWGEEGFAGASRLIPFLSWVDYFNTAGPDNFSWDWWRVPPEFVSDEIIGDWQTYGATKDWAADNLVRFGAVIPGGSGTPQAQGWPLGLTIVFDAYNFANPTVTNVTYFRALIINESDKVYGVPFDYDSLYFGNDWGSFLNDQISATYFLPELAGVLWTGNGVNPNCNNARVPDAGVGGCNFGLALSNAGPGFEQGAAAILVLNSPIGDLRNKLFSDPESPFFAPGHVAAGDTITFNQGRLCGFGGCWAGTTNRSARSGFGLHAAILDDMLDGRTEADFDASSGNAWYNTFRNFDYPTRTAAWNKWVPGDWDWNHDGVPDTLTLDTCLGPEFGAPGTGGCSELWSDTLPGRLNNSFANFGGFIGAGPFRLAAGDTVPWTIAIVTGAGQPEIEANTRNAIENYLNAYLRPVSAPPPSIVSVATTPGDRNRVPGAQVRIFFDDASENFEDPFLLLFADQIEGTPLAEDNPWLTDSLRTIARDNVAAVHVFKSCDFGSSFTADNDCDGDPATDDRGNPVGLGWQPFETFEPDEDGRFPNLFTDAGVTPGKTYLYTIVTETRGFAAAVIGRDDDGNQIAEQFEVAPVLFSVLTTSTADPSVARIYVPASRQAGAEAAAVEFTGDDPLAPVEYHPVAITLTSDIDETADFRLVFGDSVVVTQQIDAVSRAAQSATVRQFRTVDTSLDGITVVRLAYDSATYVTDNPNGVQTAGGSTSESMSGDVLTRTTVYADELTLVTLDASEAPLFTSSVLDGSGTTPGTFFARIDFPRFIVNVDDTQGGTLNSATWLEQVAPDSLRPLRALGSPSVGWLQQSGAQELAQPTGESFNEYQFEFVDFEYGPARLFTINVADPERAAAEVQASLEARAVGQVSATSPEVAAALGVAPEDLLEVNLPFTVRHEAPERDVVVAILASEKITSIPLGSDVDSLSVDVPADQWVPGERMIFLERITQFKRALTPGGEEFVVTEGGQPVIVDTLQVTWSSAVLGCTARPLCNPLRSNSPGADATSHLPVEPGDQVLRVRYLSSLTPETAYQYQITKTLAGSDVTQLTREDLDEIRVVPNPYVVFSTFEQQAADRRLMFTGLPPSGKIEIYTVSGQFVQRISFDEGDLAGNGDLYWNMRTRENTDLASGLYVFVVTGRLPATGESVQKVGKFVIIR